MQLVVRGLTTILAHNGGPQRAEETFCDWPWSILQRALGDGRGCRGHPVPVTPVMMVWRIQRSIPLHETAMSRNAETQGLSCASGGYCGLLRLYDAFLWQLAADRGRNATPSTLLHDILGCKGRDSADLVQASKDECRHREGQVDDWDTSMVVLEASCYPVDCSLLTARC